MEDIQKFENELAATEGRHPCSVGFFREENREGRVIERGRYDSERNQIDINLELLRGETPYQAVETYLHEARHAYQKAAIDNPQIHNSLDQVKDWSKNQTRTNSYINPQEGYPIYRGQPVEMDANDIARERTDAIYIQQFAETEEYSEYKAEKALEANEFKEQAEIMLGPEYEQVTRQMVVDRYEEYEMSLSKNEQEGLEVKGSGNSDEQSSEQDRNYDQEYSF